MSELLPCPFCGSRAIGNQNAGHPYIYCESCDVSQSPYDTMSESIAAWNRRSSIETLEKQISFLLKERQEDHDNINIKADFIENTMNQLAEIDMYYHNALKTISYLESQIADYLVDLSSESEEKDILND